MRRIFLAGLAFALLVPALISIAAIGTFYAWGRPPLAARGEVDAFAAAVGGALEQHKSGNGVFLLLEDGVPVASHAVSIGAPVDGGSLFQVASISKWVTALGVMALVEEGLVDLDAPVSRYLKRWSLPEGAFPNDEVTVRRLLSHTAGLTDGLGHLGFAPGEPVQSLVESLTLAADRAPHADGRTRVGVKPGSRFNYSGGGYALLELMIEDVTGEAFGAYMRRRILAPLGMTASTFEPTAESETRIAVFYGPDGSPAPRYRFAALAPASLYSSADDLARLLAAHASTPEGAEPGRGVLSPTSLDAIRQPAAHVYGLPVWGLGPTLYTWNDHGSFIIGHEGNNHPAINTSARIDPATGDGIVLIVTGDERLASRLAGEWLYWKTGHVSILALSSQIKPALAIILAGSLAIAVGLFFLLRPRTPGRR